jgi:choice-of-anchor B domain-containing protein
MAVLRRLLPVFLLLAVQAAPLMAQSGRLGRAVVVGDGEILAGEPATTFRPGAVYVYREGDGAWQEVAALTAPAAVRGDGFGSSLALAGNSLFVTSNAAIHVFTRGENGEWAHETSIAVPADAADAGFGTALAAQGNWLLAGSPARSGFRGPRSQASQRPGAVHVFRRDANGSWRAQGVLTPPNSAVGDNFGAALAMVGGRALVGAPGSEEGAGRVHTFHLSNDVWTHADQFQARGAAANDGFGTTVALEGELALVGAPAANGGAGMVVVFGRTTDNSSWIEQSRLVAFDASVPGRFGSALTTAGGDVWIGAPAPGGLLTGSTYRYTSRSGVSAFPSGEMLRPAETDPRDGFGETLAVRAGIAAIGAPGMDHNAGAVLVYRRDGAGRWSHAATLTSPPDVLSPIVGGEQRCPDSGTIEIFDCGNVELLAFLPLTHLTSSERGRGVRLNDVWGWTDSETGREYAIVGRVEGTSFVDVTDPTNPVFLGDLPQTPGGPPSSTWRDMKVYANHAFIVADAAGAHGMQVFDLTQLRDVRDAPVTFEPTAHYTGIHSAHNIVINEETGFAYSVGSSSGGETCGGGLHMIDVRDPVKPVFAGCFADTATGRRGTGYSHDAQCVIYRGPDERYTGREICLGSNENALSIADVTDKANPRAVSSASYPNPAYTHQGWLTDDHRYFFMDDELDEISGTIERTRTLVWDLSNLEDPQLHTEFFGTTAASDHNLYIRDNFMYQSNYRAGLRVIDISDPGSPVEVGYFDTAPYLENEPGFSGTWSNYPFFESGTILVTSVQEGLFLLKKRNPATVF